MSAAKLKNPVPMKVTEELKKLRQRAGLSMADMAKQMGYKTPSGYQRYENSDEFTKEYFSVIFTNKLVKALGGRGNPPIELDEILMLSGTLYQRQGDFGSFFKASATRRIPIFLMDQLDLHSIDMEPLDIETKYHGIPLETLRYTEAEDVERGFCIELTDDSMSNNNIKEISFEEGDRIICDMNSPIKPGDFVIAKRNIDRDAVFRRYRLVGHKKSGEPIVELIPLNPHYPALTLDSDTPGHIIARVQEVRKKL